MKDFAFKCEMKTRDYECDVQGVVNKVRPNLEKDKRHFSAWWKVLRRPKKYAASIRVVNFQVSNIFRKFPRRQKFSNSACNNSRDKFFRRTWTLKHTLVEDKPPLNSPAKFYHKIYFLQNLKH